MPISANGYRGDPPGTPKVPSGMASMLKSMLGIDPAQIMEAASAIKNGVESADLRLTRAGERIEEAIAKIERIESQIDRVHDFLSALEQNLVRLLGAPGTAVELRGNGATPAYGGTPLVADDDEARRL